MGLYIADEDIEVECDQWEFPCIIEQLRGEAIERAYLVQELVAPHNIDIADWVVDAAIAKENSRQASKYVDVRDQFEVDWMTTTFNAISTLLLNHGDKLGEALEPLRLRRDELAEALKKKEIRPRPLGVTPPPPGL